MYPVSSSFLFAIFFFSVTTTKLLRLSLNAHVFPVPVLIFCLPAFALTDAILIGIVQSLLRPRIGFLGSLSFVVGYVVCLVTLAAASSELGFFYRTGGEIDWKDATSFAFSQDGRKVLLSEGAAPLSFACAILLICWIIKFRLNRLVSGASSAGKMLLQSTLRWATAKTCRNRSGAAKRKSYSLPTREHYTDSDFDYDSDEPYHEAPKNKTFDGRASENWDGSAMYCTRFIVGSFLVLAMLGLLCVSTFSNPDLPYNRMFTTLPLPLVAVLMPKTIMCPSTSWPLPKLIEEAKWETPHGNYKGWAPGLANDIIRGYRQRVPEWLPSQLPDGFARWSQDARSGDEQTLLRNTTASSRNNACPELPVAEQFYNPANDPLKITNLDNPFLQPLQQVLKERSIKIKHIALILMESTREELFPLQQGSDFHNLIMKSHDELDHDGINELLSRLSPNSARITGLGGSWVSQNGSIFDRQHSEWNDKTREGFGGLNINGVLTSSSVSAKSLAAVHCGSWPLPVDMFEEAETESYQPCLPQILELFNRMKQDKTSTDDFHEQQWYPALFQSVTDGFDRQDKFDSKMGFKHIINRNRLIQDARGNSDFEEASYFGYFEPALEGYITDYIAKAAANNQRMFMTHFTSSTHHPWHTPKSFNSSEYMGEAHGLMQTHKDLNDYLNTVRFHDAWLGQLMQLFDDQGISNETLVIFVGDHGQAFKEDCSKTGTYDNPHISNHRIPITFRHPQLPRVQHQVNASSLSVLPTILDLLVHTDSLNAKDTAAAADIVQDYEGQSLLRPFKITHNGRRAWNFGVVNPGGRILTITSSDTPWRLVLPLDGKTEHIFSDLGSDPMELKREMQWSIKGLASTVRGKHGREAADWLLEANKVGLWWASERKRLWNYHDS